MGILKSLAALFLFNIIVSVFNFIYMYEVSSKFCFGIFVKMVQRSGEASGKELGGSNVLPKLKEDMGLVAKVEKEHF